MKLIVKTKFTKSLIRFVEQIRIKGIMVRFASQKFVNKSLSLNKPLQRNLNSGINIAFRQDLVAKRPKGVIVVLKKPASG